MSQSPAALAAYLNSHQGVLVVHSLDGATGMRIVDKDYYRMPAGNPYRYQLEIADTISLWPRTTWCASTDAVYVALPPALRMLCAERVDANRVTTTTQSS